MAGKMLRSEQRLHALMPQEREHFGRDVSRPAKLDRRRIDTGRHQPRKTALACQLTRLRSWQAYVHRIAQRRWNVRHGFVRGEPIQHDLPEFRNAAEPTPARVSLQPAHHRCTALAVNRQQVFDELVLSPRQQAPLLIGCQRKIRRGRRAHDEMIACGIDERHKLEFVRAIGKQQERMFAQSMRQMPERRAFSRPDRASQFDQAALARFDSAAHLVFQQQRLGDPR
ncbi:MAG TPA: hypothetical protein VHY91_20310 [Pirellulales bacterium]|nr:hypothetical protein [Pirellulales bacterium]